MPSSNDFFLSPDQTGDDWRFLAPARTGVTIEPLIDGVIAFSTIERAVASAQQTVNLSAWIFNAQMPLQAARDVNKTLSDRGTRRRVSCWGELLAAVAGAGVSVKVLLTDFDGVLQNALHEINWGSYQRMRSYATQYGGNDHLQMMVSMHPAQVSFVATLFTQAQISARFTAVLANLNRRGFSSAKSRLLNMPRIWPLVSVNNMAGRIDAVASPSFDIRPAAHHQKICVIDSQIGFCGGLDPQTGRIDTKLHDRGQTAWHDTDCKVDTPLAADLDRNFAGRWNHEMGDFNAFIASAMLGSRNLPSNPVTVMSPRSGGPTSGAGAATGQLIRTISKDSLVGNVPTNVRDDIMQAYKKAIGLAQQFVYIENQYVRSDELAGWLIDRANAAPALQIIIVLPVAPEEVASGADPITMLGLSLEHDALNRLKSTLGTRFGMYSMVKHNTASQQHATNFAHSQQIYVHSKTMIVDDVWATIGSANTNPRSFNIDTEANIHWYDPVSVKSLRLKLWKELLGSPADVESWVPGDFVSKWNQIAQQNMTRSPIKRQGFIVPHDPNKFPGQPNALIPDEYAELGDVPAESDALADDAIA